MSDSLLRPREPELQQRLKNLAAVYRLTSEVAAGRPFCGIIADVREELRKSLGATFSVVLLREGDRLVPHGRPPGFLPTMWPCGDGMERCCCAFAAKEGNSLYCADLRKEPARPSRRCGHPGAVSLAAVPMLFDGQVLGILAVASSREFDFSRNAPFLEALAMQLAIAVQNAKIEEALRSRSIGLKEPGEIPREGRNIRIDAIETAEEGIFVARPHPVSGDALMTVWNRQMQAITGYSMEEMNRGGWCRTVYVDPENQMRAQRTVHSHWQGASLRNHEREITARGGRKRIISMSTSRIYEETGAIDCLAIVLDITELKTALRSLRENARRYRALLEPMHPAMRYIDPETDWEFSATESICRLNESEAGSGTTVLADDACPYPSRRDERAGTGDVDSVLRRMEFEVESKTFEVQELKLALDAILDKKAEFAKEVEDRMATNIREQCIPFLEKLKCTPLNETQRAYLEHMKYNLENIASPFLEDLTQKFIALSPVEVQVAGLVKEGKSNKEISRILGISINTVLTHRYHLRTKLGLKNAKINLGSYLRTTKL